VNTQLAYKSVSDPVLVSAQQKLFWDERENPPAIDSARFLLRVMDMGNWQMVRAMEKAFSSDYLASVLRQAPCGALSPKSWNFWCLRLGVNFPYPERFSS
jgi:hypothetical protein